MTPYAVILSVHFSLPLLQASFVTVLISQVRPTQSSLADQVNVMISTAAEGQTFPAWSSYMAEMTGDHVDAIIADAYVKGIRGFDAEEALKLMKKNALELPATPELYREGQGRRALESYLKYGYIPLEDHVLDAFHGDEQVSRTLDYAFDDFEVSVMSATLGHTQDAQAFARRAQNYREVIDPEVGFARGRNMGNSLRSNDQGQLYYRVGSVRLHLLCTSGYSGAD